MIPEEQLNDVDFSFNKYFHYRSILGQGSFGHVVLAVSKVTLETMAVKVDYNVIIDNTKNAYERR